MPLSHKEAQEIRMLAIYLIKVPRQKLEQRFSDEGIDLTMLQHHILTMAERHQPTIAELSRMFGLDPSTLVPSVDALVKKGYLKRKRDKDDKRRYPLHLTGEGENLHQHICQHLGDDPLHVALMRLNEPDVATLRSILRQLVAAFPEGEQLLAELDEHISAHDARNHPDP